MRGIFSGLTSAQRGLLLAAVLFSGVLCAVNAGGADDSQKACVNDDCFSRFSQVGTANLPMRGLYRFEYFFFPIYSIALYAPESVSTTEGILADIPKMLVIRYHHRFNRDQIIRGGNEMMKKNPEVNFGSISSAVAQMDRLYMEAVHEEDEYEVSYVPGQGTSLYFNGELRGTVPGAEFAKAYFGIWLSRTPIDEEMRDALLGRT